MKIAMRVGAVRKAEGFVLEFNSFFAQFSVSKGLGLEMRSCACSWSGVFKRVWCCCVKCDYVACLFLCVFVYVSAGGRVVR